MAKNLVNKVLNDEDVWICPAGVTSVLVSLKKEAMPLHSTGCQMHDGSRIYAWGSNSAGQLGVGDLLDKSIPTAVLGNFNFKKYSINGANVTSVPFSYGLTYTGQLYVWGAGGLGSLGLGDILNRSSPVLISANISVKNFYHGTGVNGYSAFILSSGGQLYGTGENQIGFLGIGSVATVSSFTAVLGGLLFKKVFSTKGAYNTFGITTGGALYGWGYNGQGQLGNGDLVPRSSPVVVLGNILFKNLITQASTFPAIIGLTYDGTAYSWGYNGNGQLGVGDFIDRSSPILVLGGQKFKSINITANGAVTGFTTGGQIYTWGTNNLGQLGTNDLINKSSPVLIASNVKLCIPAPSLGALYYINNSGQAYATGFNTSGQLGVGSFTNVSSPTLILGGLSFAGIAPGCLSTYNIFGLTTSGVLYAWGYNANGELGVGDLLSKSSPVLVLSNLSVKNISQVIPSQAGSGTFFVQNGNMYFSGYGNNGSGLGDTIWRSSPVLILGSKNITSPTVQTINVNVIPGSSYTLNISDQASMLGTEPLGVGVFDSATLSYYS